MNYNAFLGILSDGELLSLSSAKFASPLGLNVLGTKIKQLLPKIFVRIYNLETSDEAKIKADIEKVASEYKQILVGLTLIAGNVSKSLQLAKWLKELGCDVIVGGPEINNLTADHFATLPMIDAVCVGFGEHTITDIIENGFKQKIFTTPSQFDFQNTAIDYSLIFELEKHGGVSMLWGGDCHLCHRRCYFCSRQKRGFGWREPKIVWDELRYPYQCGIRKLYNTADTVAVNIDQLRQLAEGKPPELAEMKIKCFINATQVTDETAALLARLNAWAAVGIESLGRVSAVGKGKTAMDDNYRAIDILAKYEVPMILTFVMGLPRETEATLQKDVKEILHVVRQYRELIYWITVSPLLITIGSRAFDDCYKLLSGNLPKKCFWEYYNPLLVTEKYFEYFCWVGLDEVCQTIAQLKKSIVNIAPEIVFDSKGLDPARWSKIENG